jgi:hypothetical protein
LNILHVFGASLATETSWVVAQASTFSRNFHNSALARLTATVTLGNKFLFMALRAVGSIAHHRTRLSLKIRSAFSTNEAALMPRHPVDRYGPLGHKNASFTALTDLATITGCFST